MNIKFSPSYSGCCSNQTNNACTLQFNPKSKTLISVLSKSRCSKPYLSLCKASLVQNNRDGDLFLQASLLVSETVRHYSLWKQGFVEHTKLHSFNHNHHISQWIKEEKSYTNHLGLGILRRFQSPTIFLKIACDGDLLLPIVAEEFAVSQLIDALNHKHHEESPDQFQLAKNIADKFGFEVNMVRITNQVVNSYHACIYLGQPIGNVDISIDARPSDALNLAERFKAPIYVSKEIVLKDAIKIVHGKWKGKGKVVYDVTLDSAIEGHDPCTVEIHLLQKMNTAILDERYKDAAMYRDTIAELRLQI